MTPIQLTCVIDHIYDVERIKQTNGSYFDKLMLKLITPDNQVLFAEMKESFVKRFMNDDIQVGMIVDVDLVFKGSEKNSKKYNNICIKKIVRNG